MLAMYLLALFLCSFGASGLQFDASGKFKILQVADMHYAMGASTPCVDVLPYQNVSCSDLNTTAFLRRVIHAEKPDLIVFTGDNIFAKDVTGDPTLALEAAFRPAVEAKIPWAAVLGNHDQEGSLNREELMKYIVKMDHSVSRVNPDVRAIDDIDGFGNYNLEIKSAELHNKSALDLFFADSGDYYPDAPFKGYAWIKDSQQFWMKQTAAKLQVKYVSFPSPQKTVAPALAFFHIPIPEYANLTAPGIVGERLQKTGCPKYNSGFFQAMQQTGSIKAAFVGHDHINDFCGEVGGIKLCHGGGFGYHAYGLAGWPRRSRVVEAVLNKQSKTVQEIRSWKRLDDAKLSLIDKQVIWASGQVDPAPAPPAAGGSCKLRVGMMALLILASAVVSLMY